MPPTAAEPTPPPSKLPGFAPSPEQARQIFEDLDNPTYSFFALAKRHKTDQESLGLWLARPEIAERVNTLESSVARRTRYVALGSFSSALHAAALILSDFTTPARISGAPPCPRETALRAARFIMRIAQFAPGAVATRSPKSTTPPTIQVQPQPHTQPQPQPQLQPQTKSEPKPEHQFEPPPPLDPIAHATQLVQTMLSGAAHIPQPDPAHPHVARNDNPPGAHPSVSLSSQSNRLIASTKPANTQSPGHTHDQQDHDQQALDQFDQNDDEADDDNNNDEWLQNLSPEEANLAAQNLVTQGILTPTQAAHLLEDTGFTTHPP